MIESRTLAFGRSRYDRPSLATAELLVEVAGSPRYVLHRLLTRKQK